MYLARKRMFPTVMGGPSDMTAPTVAITSTEESPTAASPIPITITFSEEVAGFVVGDLTVGNGTAGDFATADNIVFTANITPTVVGDVTIDIAAGVCQDLAGNDNEVATQLSILSVVGIVGMLVGDDVSGNDSDAVASYTDALSVVYSQDTPGNRPIKKTNQSNGHDVIRFDAASSQYLLANALATYFTGSDKPLTIFTVAKFNSLAAAGTVWSLANSSDINPQFRLCNTTTPQYQLFRREDGGAGSVNFLAGVPETTSFHTITVVFTGTLCSVYVDGVQIGIDTAMDVGAATLNNFSLGALVRTTVSVYGSLDLADMYVFNSAISNRQDVETYFGGRHNITLPFDSGRPDIFVIAGQSNASGRGTNNQSVTDGSYLFDNAYALRVMTDPTDDNTGQTDAVSSDAAAAGSCWPLVAGNIIGGRGRSEIFVPCAMGGTGIDDWQPGADHQDRATLYGSMVYRALQAQAYGTLRAVLWWQGEHEVVSGMDQATYNAGLDTLANAVQADLGIPLIACKLQDMSTYLTGYDESTINAAIGEAWADNANVKAGPDLSDITPAGDGVHLASDAEILEAAGRWWTAIQAALGWS